MIPEVLPSPVGVVGYHQIPVSLVGWDGDWNEVDSGTGWRRPAGIFKSGLCVDFFPDKTP